jgi:hypothetical protein
MKKTIQIFAALVIMMAISVGAKAQSPVANSVEANANVQSQLVVSQQQPLQFGSVNNKIAETKIVSLLGVATSSGGAVAQTGVQQGIGKITRTGDAKVAYKLTVVSDLDGPSGSKLPIKDFITAYNFDGTTTTAQTAGNTTVTAETIVAGTGNDIYVHIGATVTPSAATTSTGLHKANITLTATYN